MIFENFVLLMASWVLLGAVMYMVYRRRDSLSLCEVYAVMVGFYFGVWGILDTTLQNFQDYNIQAIMLVYVIVTLTLSATWYGLRVYLPQRNRASFLKYLELRTIATTVGRIPQSSIALLVFVLLLFKLYSIQKYNIVNNYDWNSLATYQIVLPSWFVIADGMFRSVLFIAVFPVAVGFFRDSGWTKARWAMIAATILLLEMMYGRSSVFNCAIIFFMYWYQAMKEKDVVRLLFQLIAGIGLFFIVLFLYSNFYQAYRSIFILKYGYTNGASYVSTKLIPTLKEKGNVLDHVLDSNKTINNFKDRPALWRFNYRFLDQQLNGGYQYVPYGTLLKEAIIFMTPRILWHDKPNFLVQPEAYKIYHFEYKYSDAPSIFAFAQIDFGFYSFLVIPLFLLLGFIPSAYGLFLTQERPILFAIITGEFGYYCVDIPRDYYGLFMYYRELVFVLLIYALLSGIRVWFLQRKVALLNRVGF